MDSVGDEKRIRALFSELSFQDQSSVPAFAELCRRRLVESAHSRRVSGSAVMIAMTLLVISACSLGVWTWYRSMRSSVPNTAALEPPATSTLQESVAQKSNNRERVVKSSAKHRKNPARLRPTDRTVLRDAALLSRWQSPTQSFLDSPADSALNSLPQLNQSADALKLFLPGNPELKKELNQ